MLSKTERNTKPAYLVALVVLSSVSFIMLSLSQNDLKSQRKGKKIESCEKYFFILADYFENVLENTKFSFLFYVLTAFNDQGLVPHNKQK